MKGFAISSAAVTVNCEESEETQALCVVLSVVCCVCVYLVSPNQAIQDPRSKIIFYILKPEIRSRILGSKIDICVSVVTVKKMKKRSC
jgi:hypothetical protein